MDTAYLGLADLELCQELEAVPEDLFLRHRLAGGGVQFRPQHRKALHRLALARRLA